MDLSPTGARSGPTCPTSATHRPRRTDRSATAHPGRVLDFASRLLPVAAPGSTPTSSIRPGRTDPAIHFVGEGELAAAALAEASALAEEHALVAIIVPEDLAPDVTRLPDETTGSGVLERDAMTRPVTIVPAPAAKGLEFDAVVVVEPAAIAGDDRRGPAAALRRHDPPDPAPERRPLPAPPRPPPRLSGAFPYDPVHGTGRRRQGRSDHRRQQRHR